MPQSPPDHSDNQSFDRLIEAARRGDSAALSDLINSCRDYLLLVANEDLHVDLRAKLGASDVVQQALLSAHRALDEFEGDSRSDFLAWVRGILKNDMLEAHRHYRGAQKRNVTRENPIDDSRQLGAGLKDPAHTPGTHAATREEIQLLKEAMKGLSPEYREILELRNWQQLPFAEIGQRMNRSEDAARKLWARAVLQLQQVMKDVST